VFSGVMFACPSSIPSIDTMSIAPLLEELFAMTFFGIKPGLERIETLLRHVDDPHVMLPVIHVAGTNGKGSTCAMLAAILQRAGYKTGLYTSPHITRFNERIRIDGNEITDEDIARLARPLMDAAKPIGGTFFEVTTAMALQYFAEQRVDVAIIETGLGGRLDATNVVSPLLTIITSIDIDHEEYLGSTLTDIAGEKAGIIKADVPCIITEPRPELRSVFEQRAQRLHAPLTFVDDVLQVDVDSYHPDLTMTVSVIDQNFRYYLTTDLCGPHQARNLAGVIAALPVLRSIYFITEDHVRLGLQHVQAATGHTGRIQLRRHEPPLVLDVAHNPAGMKALVDTLAACGLAERPWQVVFGAMADKDVDTMLTDLEPLTQTLYVCAPDYKRSTPPEELANRARRNGFTDVRTFSTVADAIRAALQANTAMLVCGSFYVAEEAVAALPNDEVR